MIQCINPNCIYANPHGTNYCQNCGDEILLHQRYRPIKLLGEGGFGRTFQAIDEKRPNSQCVIKQIFPQQGERGELAKAKQLFQQDVVRLQNIGKHPQIPELLDYFFQDSRFYFVQEFIDGQNLFQKFENDGKFNELQLKYLLEKILPILQFIHDHQVIHGDINPGNIIINKNGKYCLVDLGISLATRGNLLTRIGSIKGTPGYAAPEEYHGKLYDTTDLYSLAVTCVGLLTGYFPNIDGSYKLFDSKMMTWKWQNYVSISQELKTVLETMLMDIPVKRYHSAKVVLEILNQEKISIKSHGQATAKTEVAVNPVQKIFQHIYTSQKSKSYHKKEDKNYHKSTHYSQLLQVLKEDLEHGIYLEMIAIPERTFFMGSPKNEHGRRNSESPQHQVKIKPFYMSKFLITQLQWERVAMMEKVKRDIQRRPSNFRGRNKPVEKVSWLDAQEFCARLSKHTGKNYRLPSESEWEYAGRAGTQTAFYFGDHLSTSLVNCREHYGQYRTQTTDVGSFQANGFGLYDILGNVCEWCEDDFHKNYLNAPTDGSAWIDVRKNDQEADKVLRGGAWDYSPSYCRCASRIGQPMSMSNDMIGFRVVVDNVE